MKKMCRMAATLFVMSCAMASAFAAEEAPWYGGISLGHGEAKRTGSWAEQTDLSFRGQGVTSLTTISTGSSAWKMFGGYQFDENFGVEASYARLGKFNGTSTVTAPAAGTGSGKWEADAFSVAAIGTLPIHENRVAAFGKLGLAYTRLSVSATATGGGTAAAFSPSNDRINPMLGVGIRFDLTKKVGLRAEFEHYNNVGEGGKTGQSSVEMLSIGMQYRF